MFPKVLQTLVKYYNKPIRASTCWFLDKLVTYYKGEKVDVGLVRDYRYENKLILYRREVTSTGRKFSFIEYNNGDGINNNIIKQFVFDRRKDLIIPSTLKMFKVNDFLDPMNAPRVLVN